MVVGLGNPGAEYGGKLRGVKGCPVGAEDIRIGGLGVVLAEPTTYMNDSGLAVAPLLRRHGVDDPARLVVVHDELDLPPGRLRVKVGGGLAGHNGLRSIRSQCRTDEFVRVRIGVGKPPDPQRGADHVLRRVPSSERRVLDEVIVLAADAVECIALDGPEVAAERFNGIVVA